MESKKLLDIGAVFHDRRFSTLASLQRTVAAARIAAKSLGKAMVPTERSVNATTTVQTVEKGIKRLTYVSMVK